MEHNGGCSKEREEPAKGEAWFGPPVKGGGTATITSSCDCNICPGPGHEAERSFVPLWRWH